MAPVRRAKKLYYLRDRRGKSARIAERTSGNWGKDEAAEPEGLISRTMSLSTGWQVAREPPAPAPAATPPAKRRRAHAAEDPAE